MFNSAVLIDNDNDILRRAAEMVDTIGENAG
jgi:hypothetical protein